MFSISERLGRGIDRFSVAHETDGNLEILEFDPFTLTVLLLGMVAYWGDGAVSDLEVEELKANVLHWVGEVGWHPAGVYYRDPEDAELKSRETLAWALETIRDSYGSATELEQSEQKGIVKLVTLALWVRASEPFRLKSDDASDDASTEQKTCPACGTSLPGNVRFCTKCGKCFLRDPFDDAQTKFNDPRGYMDHIEHLLEQLANCDGTASEHEQTLIKVFHKWKYGSTNSIVDQRTAKRWFIRSLLIAPVIGFLVLMCTVQE